MYDTAKRVALVKQRVWENTRRRQRRGIYRLSTACMLLCTVLMQAAGMIIGKGQTATRGVFGTMLLREDAGGYVLVAIVSFAAAVVITVLCFRLRIRENQKKRGGQAEPIRTGGDKPMKKRILSILVICCMVLGLLPTTAFADNDSVKKPYRLAQIGISGYDSTNSSYDYIHFGTWNNSTVKWRVLDTKQIWPMPRGDGFSSSPRCCLGQGNMAA